MKKKYDGIIDEILYYSERDENGRWIIPIAVDWDYTLTKCSSWEDGEMILNETAFPIMRKWIDEYNVGFILDTMRHDDILQEPLKILEEEHINLYGIRRNPQQDKDGNTVTKAFAVFSVDDRNVNIPQKWYEDCTRPYVDWEMVDEIMTPILEHISNQLKKVVL